MSYPSNDTMDSEWRTTELDASVCHGLLASEHRRLALDVLADEYPTVELETLAADVAEREAESDAVEDGSVESVTIALHHAHLPRLDDAGVVDYDPETRQVDPDAELVEAVLSVRSFL